MGKEKLSLLLITLVGGLAVIASYVWGFTAYPDASTTLWGGVPASAIPVYTTNMLLAAGGFLFFTAYLLFGIDASQVKVFINYDFRLFIYLYAVILVLSALWMPFSIAAYYQSSIAFLWVVRLVLWITGLASLVLLSALLTLQPRGRSWVHWAAVVGCIFFCVQTVILDAVTWVIFFKI